MKQWAKRPSNTPPLHYFNLRVDALVSHRARLQGNRLKTRDADWNGFAWTNWRHFLFVLRIAAMTWRRCAFVIEIFADSIRIEHFCGNELPADVPKPIAEREFVTGIDPNTVSEGQRPAGFLNDRALVGACDQERSDDEEEECLGSHEQSGVSWNSAVLANDKIVLFQAVRNQFRKLAIFHKRT
jgi:hypothetical protein